MKLQLIISITILLLQQNLVFGQTETYAVTKASFSSDKFDEYSPVYYKNGIVFCTNRNSSMVNYSNSQNKGQFKINYIDTTGKVRWRNSVLFSKSLKSKMNDGPATFDHSGDTIFFSRNLRTDGSIKELTGLRNKLGIFSAAFDGKEWTNLKEFRFNNEWYNVTTPFLSPDGTRLFFASDKPDGYGGSDLYYCEWKGEYWDSPINLGSKINTPGNEAYPFINQAGELFFSSDGHPGLGGKDIYFSRFADAAWMEPVRLDPPVNSEFDDFGLITDSMMNEGYFSSKRAKTIDIFHYKTNYSQLFYCDIQRVNQFCIKFTDKETLKFDKNNFLYEWDFGDGNKMKGLNVEHCYSGNGDYLVKLNIIEKSSGRIFFTKLTYNLELKDVEQPVINSSPSAITGDTIKFDGLMSSVPGNKIIKYTWDFGDGEKAMGDIVKHSYREKGEYEIKLGLTLQNDSTKVFYQKCVTKNFPVLNNTQDVNAYQNQIQKLKSTPNILDYDPALVRTLYSADKEISQDAVFHVEVLNSPTRLGINNSVFRNIPRKYTIKEVFLEEKNLYSYIVDEEMGIMATYPAYNELAALGFKNAVVKTYILTDPVEKELNTLKKVYGLSADLYFSKNNYAITSPGIALLDQIAGLMNKYPRIRLEIAVHTDNTGLPNNNQELSQKRATEMVNYLIKNRGITSSRLVAKGYGEARPIAPNFLEADRTLNRRIQITIL